MKILNTMLAKKGIVEATSAILFLLVGVTPAYASLTFTADTITSTDSTNGLVITTAAAGTTFTGGPVKFGAGASLDVTAAGALNIGTTTATSIVMGNNATTAYTFTGSAAGGGVRTLSIAAPTANAGDVLRIVAGTGAAGGNNNGGDLMFRAAAATGTGVAGQIMFEDSTGANMNLIMLNTGVFSLRGGAQFTPTGGSLTLATATNGSFTVTPNGTGDTIFSTDAESKVIFSGGNDAQADITTPANERLYIYPGGTGSTHFHQDENTNFMWGIYNEAANGAATNFAMPIAQMMFDTGQILSAGSSLTGMSLDLSTSLTTDVGGNAITAYIATVPNGGAGTTVGYDLTGAADIGIRLGGATTDISTAAGESLTIQPTTTTAANTVGGSVTVAAGTGAGTGNGGDLNLRAGAAGGGAAGTVMFRKADNSAANLSMSDAGVMTLAAGNTVTNTGATLVFNTSTATDDSLTLAPATGGAGRFAGILTSADVTVANKTWTFPDVTGNIVLDTGGATTGNVLLETEIDASTELLALMDDETGTGALVFANTPTFVSPVLGAATGTSLATSAQNIFTAASGTAPTVFRSATATDDDINVLPFAGGAGRFAGILTSADVTVA
ncbi:MAG: hypothetical protein AAB400_04410, partial [Patescibacteria group bacterium]